jgi:secondary thiamine-phosphate synthase enzyme
MTSVGESRSGRLTTARPEDAAGEDPGVVTPRDHSISRAAMIQPQFLPGPSSLLAHADSLSYRTEAAPEFIDITDDVAEIVYRSGIVNGIAVVFCRHTTAAIKINEAEPELIKDMTRFLSAIAPANQEYCHNNFDVRTVNMEEDECPNAHSHCQHLLLSSSETVPVIDGRLQLGRWQRIFLVELDRAKDRQVTCQVLGV